MAGTSTLLILCVHEGRYILCPTIVLPLSFISFIFFRSCFCSPIRDKYMFHQANVVPTDLPDGSGQSLLAYWYQQVMEELTSYLAFPVTVGICSIGMRA